MNMILPKDRFLIITFLIGFFSVNAQDFPVDAPYQLVFSDEFSAPQLDTSKWHTKYGGEPPFDVIQIQDFCDWSKRAMFSSDALVSTDSTLKIMLEKGPFKHTSRIGNPSRPCGEPMGAGSGCTWVTCDTVDFSVGYRTGIIETKQAFNYCFFEARVRSSNTPGAWPALWVWHHDEIDLFEFFGDPNRFCSNYHKAGLGGPNSECYDASDLGVDFREFHVWGLEWLPDRMIYYFDGEPIRTVFQYQGPKNTPWTYSTTNEPQKAFLKKDKYFPDGKGRWFRPILNNSVWGEIKDEDLPGFLEVDWVRVYQKKGFGKAKKQTEVDCSIPFSAPDILCLGKKESIGILTEMDATWEVSPNLLLNFLPNGHPEISMNPNSKNEPAFVKMTVQATDVCPERILKHELWLGSPKRPVVAAEVISDSNKMKLLELANAQANASITFKTRKGEQLPERISYRWLKRYQCRVENSCGVAERKGWVRARR